ncbi:DUF3019 domain-containing protein [Pseudoalteromonas sp. McH1-7]|uniref:DUF3019 domain-containing protein n=1 Tax=Pseudoalteromonas peptidolytica F12-50-A1 TaxID=1315280 RepID=A0A8I0MYK4_9GAMM|nr:MULTISPECIES: DUF3019 domain-containing protein [Pseudoalteromonas]MBE0347727.1 hypothetical protein [Pseudoalteromonas peptidolytica F12-50-A1]MDW7549792.1 DUF3019 domain-containing protein [Pseudoalteromonas peptidolytica]NLR16098.1 DUF3019 domain-containing protein [Pseudoalteromonas peptidolytica]NUZ11484.1 DUF3019 domain-containing protein [Pseudoalteromonas sp. McH1-7]RRS08814.1 DUF3019 domain-containing protein [Pseudoalteromonas sp. J010]
MFSKLITWIVLSLSMLLSYQLQAQEIETVGILHAVPSKCVALNQGRTCYADVKVTVNAPSEGDYCIRESLSKKILQCWAKADTFKYELDFSSDESLSYELISKKSRDVLAVTTIEVNWVHKVKTKKRRWRLF